VRIDCLKQDRFNIFLLRLLESLGNKESSFSQVTAISWGLVVVFTCNPLLLGILGGCIGGLVLCLDGGDLHTLLIIYANIIGRSIQIVS